jgi:ActR/RegA family two-component response regulator
MELTGRTILLFIDDAYAATRVLEELVRADADLVIAPYTFDAIAHVRRFTFSAAVIDYAKNRHSRDHLVEALVQRGTPILVLTTTPLPTGWNAVIANSVEEIVPRLVSMLEH